MSEPLRVFGPDELFGCEEYWEFEVEAIPCPDGLDPKSAKGKLEIKSCDSFTEIPATQIEHGADPDRPAA